ncbi:MAG: ATP-binding protein [Bacillota bacterium]|nr:ATP-binding protein [Bacillota bacterium]
MIKGFFNKSLKFQITCILVIILFFPAAILIYNVVVPNNSERVYGNEQLNRLKSITDSVSKSILEDQGKQINSDDGSYIQNEIQNKVVPLANALRGIRIGFYIPMDDKNYVYGRLNRPKVVVEGNTTKDQINEDLQSGIQETIESKTDKSESIKYSDGQLIRYIHPVIKDDRILVIVWSDTMMPSDLFINIIIRRYILLITLLSVSLGLIIMLLILKNVNRNISEIRKGLELMPNDASYRIGSMGGEIGLIAGSINDMAEALEKRKHLEEQLVRAEKLASLGHLISGVAHEIRNPLGIIRGTVQLMEKQFKNIEGLEEYINVVIEQSDRENKVIQELLDYARPSKQVLTYVNINDLVKSVLFFTNKYIQDKHIELKMKLDEKLPQINIDADKIKQVFVNIIINACEAMGNGGELKIISEKVDKCIKISFKDTGTGMDENELKNIFNPYYTTKPKGTGLGLSISNGIIELHGGRIEVASKKNEGSIFSIFLPVF